MSMREFLKGLDFDKEMIDTVMAEHGKLITSTKEELATANQTIKDLQDAVKKFDGVDVETLKKSAADDAFAPQRQLFNGFKYLREKGFIWLLLFLAWQNGAHRFQRVHCFLPQ